jgi:hypothetical protein
VDEEERVDEGKEGYEVEYEEWNVRVEGRRMEVVSERDMFVCTHL